MCMVEVVLVGHCGYTYCLVVDLLGMNLLLLCICIAVSKVQLMVFSCKWLLLLPTFGSAVVSCMCT